LSSGGTLPGRVRPLCSCRPPQDVVDLPDEARQVDAGSGCRPSRISIAMKRSAMLTARSKSVDGVAACARDQQVFELVADQVDVGSRRRATALSVDLAMDQRRACR
jgi:hypothetical protein